MGLFGSSIPQSLQVHPAAGALTPIAERVRMHLSEFTSHGLRLMMFIASASGERVTIKEAAAHYAVPRFQLMKVAAHLVQQGLLQSQRGPMGGLKLARPASKISIGCIVRATEDFSDFLDRGQVHGICQFALEEAALAFLAELDTHSLANCSWTCATESVPITKPIEAGEV